VTGSAELDPDGICSGGQHQALPLRAQAQNDGIVNLSEYRLLEFGTLSSKSLNMHDLHQAKSSYKAHQTR